MGELPLILLVGRPNVGKSTLFNRLLGKRRAIVHGMPGMTRDALFADVDWNGRRFRLGDSGGMELDESDGLLARVWETALAANRHAAVTLFLVDGRQGLLPADEGICRRLQRAGCRSLILVVNKIDDAKRIDLTADFYRLGITPTIAVSAEHGYGVDELLDQILSRIPEAPRVEDAAPAPSPESPEVEAEVDRPIRVAIIGRPNVGKSTLFNRLVGSERSIVSPIAGTTRDPIDVELERDGVHLILIDTAGIRRRGRTARGPEVLSVVMARRAIEQADIALIVVDAVAGLAAQDIRVAGMADELGRGWMVAMTKWDLVTDPEARRKQLEQQLEDGVKFGSYAPHVSVSGLSGRGLGKLVKTIAKVDRNCARMVPTAALNRVFERRFANVTLPAPGATDARVLYATQVGVRPPTFVFFTSRRVAAHFSTARFMVNRLREAFELDGTPVRVLFRARRERGSRSSDGSSKRRI